MAVVVNDVISWVASNEAKPLGMGTTYTQSELDLIERCLNAVIAQITTTYTVADDDSTWTEDINLAVIMQTARLIERRMTPNGTFAISEFGQIRMSGFDPDVKALLAPYLTFRFAQSQETIDAA